MILILGAGGQGLVVADIYRAWRAEGAGAPATAFVDDDPTRTGLVVAGSRVLGRPEQIPQLPHDQVIVAIGDNRVRESLFARLHAAGERFAVARHPRSIVAEGVTVGEGTAIAAGAVVCAESTVGRNVIINTSASVDHHSHVGDHAHIGPGVHMGGEVRVGEGALIGIGATVLPGIRIGAWSTVGAGAVVVEDVPPGATVVGVPARATVRRVRRIG